MLCATCKHKQINSEYGKKMARLGFTGCAFEKPWTTVSRETTLCASYARGPMQGQPKTTAQPCPLCGYLFDLDALGRYGCPNCLGEGLQGK
jgi:hypothetical protein